MGRTLASGVVFAVLVGASVTLLGQPQQEKPLAFEVASVKPSEGARPSGRVPPDRFVRHSISLSQLLVYAYEISDFQIERGEAWTRTERFDIEAKAEGKPSAEQLRLMVRQLLAERFKLTLHTESRDLPRYALVKARSDGRLGEKLRPSALDCPALTATGDSRLTTGCVFRFGAVAGVRTLIIHGTPMSQLVRVLQVDTGRVVVDQTGLTGTYDIDLESEQPQIPGVALPPGQPTTPREGLSLFTAVEEQLGLKLESERGSVDVLVIDHVERPTPD